MRVVYVYLKKDSDVIIASTIIESLQTTDKCVPLDQKEEYKSSLPATQHKGR